MPAMIRPKTEATKIAYSVLGKPYKSRSKESRRLKEIEDRLLASETSLAR